MKTKQCTATEWKRKRWEKSCLFLIKKLFFFLTHSFYPWVSFAFNILRVWILVVTLFTATWITETVFMGILMCPHCVIGKNKYCWLAKQPNEQRKNKNKIVELLRIFRCVWKKTCFAERTIFYCFCLPCHSPITIKQTLEYEANTKKTSSQTPIMP